MIQILLDWSMYTVQILPTNKRAEYNIPVSHSPILQLIGGPANTKHLYSICGTSAQRLRH